MFQLCEARPDLSGAHFFAEGKALAKNSGNGGRIKAPKLMRFGGLRVEITKPDSN